MFRTLQIAICQMIYNLLGIVLFYPIPPLRRFPIFLSMKLGDTVAKVSLFAFKSTLMSSTTVVPLVRAGLHRGDLRSHARLPTPALIFTERDHDFDRLRHRLRARHGRTHQLDAGTTAGCLSPWYPWGQLTPKNSAFSSVSIVEPCRGRTYSAQSDRVPTLALNGSGWHG